MIPTEPRCQMCEEKDKLLARIAAIVASQPTVTGLQAACVNDHSIIPMAIRDAQKHLQRHPEAHKTRGAIPMTAPLRPQSAEQPRLQITIDELERLYSASKTCFDPKHNLFWANFTKAINNYFAEAYARAARDEALPVGRQLEAVLYVVEELSPSCTVWTPVQFGSFVAEQEIEALALHEQFIATYPTRQFRVARYLRDDQ